jgi:hypothetical protein
MSYTQPRIDSKPQVRPQALPAFLPSTLGEHRIGGLNLPRLIRLLGLKTLDPYTCYQASLTM